MDFVEGSFTYNSGSRLELTGGYCNSNVVLWKPYPSTFFNFGSTINQLPGLKPQLT